MNQSSVSADQQMRLQVLLPTEVLLDQQVGKVIAEAENGEFCLLPKHVDFVAALVPGVMSFWTAEAGERYVAVDQGVLVKCGRDVFVSTLHAVQGTNLGQLQTLVEEQYLELDEHQRKARTALARLEAGALRGFRDLQEKLHG